MVHQDLIESAREVRGAAFGEHGTIARVGLEESLFLGQPGSDRKVLLNVLLGSIDDCDVSSVHSCNHNTQSNERTVL